MKQEIETLSSLREQQALHLRLETEKVTWKKMDPRPASFTDVKSKFTLHIWYKDLNLTLHHK